jgi:hypothetical protein
MRLAAAVLVALLAAPAAADCTPAPAAQLAEAERAAQDAERKATQAESVAVRSGNPGAAKRAEQARLAATEARRHALALACKAEPPPRP